MRLVRMEHNLIDRNTAPKEADMAASLWQNDKNQRPTVFAKSARCYRTGSGRRYDRAIREGPMNRLAKIAVITVALVLFALLVYLAIVSRLEGWPPPAERFRPID